MSVRGRRGARPCRCTLLQSARVTAGRTRAIAVAIRIGRLQDVRSHPGSDTATLTMHVRCECISLLYGRFRSQNEIISVIGRRIHRQGKDLTYGASASRTALKRDTPHLLCASAGELFGCCRRSDSRGRSTRSSVSCRGSREIHRTRRRMG